MFTSKYVRNLRGSLSQALSMEKRVLFSRQNIRNASYKTFSEVPNKTEFGALSGTTTTAIVSRTSKKPDLDWELVKGIQVRENLQENEVLVQLTSAGICHTDITMSQNEGFSPRILGHEGAGKILKVGNSVTDHKPGDQVILSYSSCGECTPCKKHKPGFCTEFNTMNFGDPDVLQTFTGPDGTKITGNFFGQSSFSQFTIVDKNNVINLSKMNLSEDDANRLGPLGCGFMTGAGAPINSGELVRGDSVLVFGCGGVGALLIMGSKLKGAYPIIAADLDQAKLDMALEVGATHVVNVKDFEKARQEIQEITNGKGVDISVVCVGGIPPIENAISVAANLGKVVIVGFGNFTDVFQVNPAVLMANGHRIIGSVEGDADGKVFLPEMIEWYKNGDFPIDKIETFYHVEDFKELLDDLKTGKTTKAIVVY